MILYKYGENINAYYSEDGKTLNIIGSGQTYNYDEALAPFLNYDIEHITISEGITKIGNNIFNNLLEIKRLYILEQNCNISESKLCKNNELKVYYNESNTEIKTYCQDQNIQYIGYNQYYLCGDRSYLFFNIERHEFLMTGIGGTYDITTTNIPWKDEVEKIQKINIDDYITKIGNKIFAQMPNLNEVYMGKNVLEIGDYVFYNNKRLTKVQFNNELTKIGDKAFYNCTSLDEMDLPKKLSVIGDYAFYNCKSLQYVNIPKGVERIRSYAFANCSKLKKVKMDKGVKFISERVFDSCVSLADIEFPESLCYISSYGFNNCASLEDVNLPYGIYQLNMDAFSECPKIKHFSIPDSVTSYGNCIFREDIGLENLKLSANAKIWDALCLNCTNLKNVIIPYGVKEIRDRNFYGCSSIEKIKFPNSIVSIGNNNFDDGSNLKIIAIPSSVTSIGRKSRGTHDEIKIYCKSDSYAKQYAIENGYEYIEDNIAPIISNVEITDSIEGTKKVTVIASDDNEILGLADYAYSFDGGITWQEEPYKIFTTSTEVKIIVIDSVGNVSESIEKNITTESNIEDLSKNGDLSIIAKIENETKLVISGNGEMKDFSYEYQHINFWKERNVDNLKITNVEVEEGITSLGKYAFCNLENLVTVNLPTTISLIGDGAFKNCYNLSNINIPNNVKEIGEQAFYQCNNVINEINTENIENIGSWAFWCCNNIQRILVNNNTEYIGNNSFYNVKKVYYNSSSEAMKVYLKNSSNSSTQYIIDNVGPEVTKLELNDEKITLTAIDKGGTKSVPIEDGSGVYLYSFDGGETWQESNEYKGNINNIIIVLKDKVGNEKRHILLEKIEVMTQPNITKYAKGTVLTNEMLAGGKIQVTYDDGSTQEIEITANMVTGYNKDTVGEQELTVTYGGKTTTFKVTVTNNATGISMVSLPRKTTYVKGTNLDVTGGKIQVTYEDGSKEEKEITANMVTGYNKNTLGEQELTVTYEGKTTAFKVTVTNNVTGISMVSLPRKTTYVKGTNLDVTGGKIQVTYEDGSNEEKEITANMVTGYNKNTLGEQELTVTYKGKTTTFIVEVIISGDINGDEILDVADLLLIKRHLIAGSKEEWKLSEKQQKYADIDNNGVVDVSDLLYLKRKLLNMY